MLYKFIGDPNATNKRLEPEEVAVCRQISAKERVTYNFPREEPVDVTDEFILAKLAGHNHFVRCDADGEALTEGADGDVHDGATVDEGNAKAGRARSRGSRRS